MKNPIHLFGLLALSFLLFGCGKEEAAPEEDNKLNLAGEWDGKGYYCPSGYVPYFEFISIAHDLETGEVVATKIIGDDCVTSGNMTFTGFYDGKSETFEVTFLLGNPTFPNSDYGNDIITIVDENEMHAGQDGGITFTRAFYSNLPPCPCLYSEGLDGKEEKGGAWKDFSDGCFGISTLDDYHYGARYEIRWAESSDAPGQQCTYDEGGKLITAGIAAGTPDRFGVPGCFLNSDHIREDVNPWKSIPCYEYLTRWKPNAPSECGEVHEVNGIRHMPVLVGDMDCEAVLKLFKMVDASASVILKKYFHNEEDYHPNDLIRELQRLLGQADCDEVDCEIIEMAIENLS